MSAKSTDAPPSIEICASARTITCPKTDVPKNGAGQCRYRIQALIDTPDKGASYVGKVITVCGWARTVRRQGGGQFCFVSLNDGSTTSNLQVIVHNNMPAYQTVAKSGVGCAFKFTGSIVVSPAEGQAVEMCLNDPEIHRFTLFGGVDASKYPLSKKQHGREFLREIAYV